MEQHATWLAACQLASRRRTMADTSYNVELDSARQILALRSTTGNNQQAARDIGLSVDQLNVIVTQKLLRKMKRQQVQLQFDELLFFQVMEPCKMHLTM